jgi:carboxypeptidase family protein
MKRNIGVTFNRSFLAFCRGRHIMFTSLGLLLILWMGSLPGSAQVGYATATLHGTVYDPSGSVVPSATVTVTDPSTGMVKTVKTGTDGTYEIPALKPGTYQVQVEAPGFGKILNKNMVLMVGQSVPFDAHLKLGEASEVIEVSTEAPLIQVDQTQQANAINQMQVEALPNVNRNFTQAVYTLPGVTNSDAGPRAAQPGFTGFFTTGFSIGGSNGRNNLSTIDGGENEYGTGQYRVATIPVDSIQEFQVNRSSFAPEFGFTTGSAINIVTKSGTNNVHGDLFGYFGDRYTSAQSYFNGIFGIDNPYAQNFFTGGSLGAPLAKDKLFFFTSYEFQKSDVPLVNNLLQNSEAQGLNAQSTSCPAQLGPAPTQACYLNALAASSGNGAIAAAVLRSVLVPANNPLFQALMAPYNGTFDDVKTRNHNWVTRLDYHPSERDAVSARLGLSHNDLRSDYPGQATTASPNLLNRDYSILTNWTRIINPKLVNQALVQIVPWNRATAFFTSPGSNGTFITLGELGFFGNNLGYPYSAHQNRYQFEDSVSWTRGDHTFKFGASYRAANYHVQDNLWFSGEFDFLDGALPIITPFANGSPLQAAVAGFNLNNGFPIGGPPSTNFSAAQSFDIGAPIEFKMGAGNPKWQGWGHYFGSFVQDTWKVRRNFTLNYGTRLDYDGEPSPLSAQVYASPRVGFSWDLMNDGKTVIRGGSGIFASPIDLLIPSYASLLDGSGRYVNEVSSYLSRTDLIPAALWLQGVLGSPAAGIAPNTLPLSTLTPGQVFAGSFGTLDLATAGSPGSILYGVQKNYKYPYSVQASLSVARQLANNLSLEIGYNMYHGVHMQMPVETGFHETPCSAAEVVDPFIGPCYAPNQIIPAGPAAGTALHPQVVTYSSIGSSIYHGLTTSLTKRVSHGLQFQVNYTFSKTIDDYLDFASFQDWFRPTRLGDYRAISAFDVPHNFVANAVYTTPHQFTDNFLGKIFGDFTLAPVVTLQSGTPFSLRTPGLAFVNGPNLTPGTLEDFNFAMPFAERRNSDRTMPFYSFDMRISKSIRLNSEKTRLNLTAQGTNLLNRANLNHVTDTFPSDPNFPLPNGGTLLAGPYKGLKGVKPTNVQQLTEPLFYSPGNVPYQPRQVQFGLSLSF